ncbi:MAG: AMP-binding protein, partial [Deltaproteobacteria bacterium]|nr:AMP-binding protein [Deltaproteobacteria bacterium]
MASLKETDTQDQVNLSSHLRRMARMQPFKRAVCYPVKRDSRGRLAYSHLTFLQLEQESDCVARGMEKAGILRGTRAFLMVKPGPEFFVLTFALFKVGAVPVLVEPAMGLKRILGCLKESEPEAFIGMPSAHILRKLYPGYFKSVKTCVTVGHSWFWGGRSLNEIRELPWRPYRIANTRKNEIAAILFTAGTTGTAKGTIYTHGIFEAQLRHIKSHFLITPDEVDLPTFSFFALFDPALGMTAIIPDMDPTRPDKVDPDDIIEPILNQGVTNIFVSPGLLHRVGCYGKERGIKLPSLKRVISTGAPSAASSIEAFATMLRSDVEIHTPYGATEAIPVSSIGSKEILSETKKLSEQGFGICIGRPLKGIEMRIIRILDEPILSWSENLMVTDGDIGEIVVSGDLVTSRYYNRPRDEAFSKIRAADRIWHRMGDLGWKDTKGRFWFCGLKSHRVQTEKGTLFTIPCETVFNNHPEVHRSALVGVGELQNQTPVICIEL